MCYKIDLVESFVPIAIPPDATFDGYVCLGLVNSSGCHGLLLETWSGVVDEPPETGELLEYRCIVE